MYIPRKYCAVNLGGVLYRVTNSRLQVAVEKQQLQELIYLQLVISCPYLSLSLCWYLVSHCTDEELPYCAKPPNRSYFDLHFLQNQIEQREWVSERESYI
jgi:hypothetical protein